MRGYRRLARYPLRQWRGLAWIILLTLSSAGAAVLAPWPLKILIDDAVGNQDSPQGLHALLASLGLSTSAGSFVVLAAVASLLIAAINTSISAGLSWAWAAVGQRMVFDLAGDLFGRLQRLSLLYHTRRSVGDSLSRLSDDAWCVYSITDALLVVPIQHLATLLFMGAVAYQLDPGLALIALASAPVLGASAYYFGRRLKRRARLDREARSRLTSFVHQTLTAIPIVQAFGTEDRNRDHFHRLAADSVRISKRSIFLNRSFSLVNGLATSVGAAVVLFLGGKKVLLHNAHPGEGISLGTLLLFMSYINGLRAASQGLLSNYANLRSAEASIDRVLEVLDASEEVEQKPAALEAPPGHAAGHIRLEAVGFGYQPGRPVLHDISFEARPGQVVALVGPTGSGKSTLVSLVPRFFDPWTGRVLIGGLDVRDLNVASLRAKVALVLQEPLLLPLTIAENIAYGRPGATRSDIEAAAQAAHAQEFIAKLPQGYDTVIGERGATLSGGQRQRLSIARALLKDAPILILDEPTSALDAQSERLILQALEKLMAQRTTLVIAHRLSTVRRADLILVLEAGRIVERGTHPQLLASAGSYSRNYHLQFHDSSPPPSAGGSGDGG